MTNFSPALMVRELNDTDLDAIYRLAPVPVVEAELNRRGEIRVCRALRGEDVSGAHEAVWYESRPEPTCPDCGHGMHHDERYQRCGFFAGVGAYEPCNCQNVPAYDFEEAYA